MRSEFPEGRMASLEKYAMPGAVHAPCFTESCCIHVVWRSHLKYQLDLYRKQCTQPLLNCAKPLEDFQVLLPGSNILYDRSISFLPRRMLTSARCPGLQGFIL